MIELIIVLAIAAIVLIGVLVAAQALQRASRNHQRSADVNFVLATVNEYQANAGKTPWHIRLIRGKLEEGLQYYLPIPAAISPSDVFLRGKSSFFDVARNPAYAWNVGAIATPSMACG